MAFDLNDHGRTVPAWIKYRVGSVSARFFVKPRDVDFVEELNTRHPAEERLGLGGRVESPQAMRERRRAWMREYLTHHLLDWDVEADGAKAPINGETVMALTDGMRSYLLEATSADDLRDYAADPLGDSGAISKPAPTSPDSAAPSA